MKKYLLPVAVLSIFHCGLSLLTINGKLPTEGWFNFASLVLAFFLLLMLLIDFRKKYYNNHASYGTMFKDSFIIAIAVSVIVTAGYYFYATKVAPETFQTFMSTQMERQKQIMIDNGQYNAQIDSMMDKFMNVNMLTLSSFLMMMISGVIAGAIASVFARTKDVADNNGVPLQ